MASTIKVKRSSSSGAAPNTTHISTGEIALNTADGILYSSDGSSVFEIGANLTSLAVNGDTTFTSADAGSTAGPEFKLYRNSSSPADGDYLGQIKFAGESDTGVERNYAKITGKIGDATNGTEDGIIEIAHIKAGSQNINVRMTSTEFKIMNGTDFDIETHDGSSNGLRLNGTLVTSTAAELNRLDGISSAAVGETDSQTLTNKTLTSPSIGTGFTLDSVTIGTIQTSGESFADNDTSLMTSAAIADKIESYSYITASDNITGSAATLTTARTIGGVSFDGSANIDLPGVNTAGNQNTSGSAATLTTARTIGGVSFDGSANINLPGVNTAGNQDTSGNAATVTNGVYTSRTLTAGTGLTGGGTLAADRTFAIDSTVATLTGSQTLTNKTLTSPSIGTGFTFDSITITAVQTSGESFVDNDTSLMTSAAIDDRINAAGGGGGGSLELYAENPSSPTAPSATGTNAVAIGSNTEATGDRSMALIEGANATGLRGFAVGFNTTASGSNSVAMGASARATAAHAFAIGTLTDATSINSLAVGHNAQTATGASAVAIGQSYASGTDSFAAAIANNSSSYGATGTNSVAIGRQAKATAQDGVAIGDTTLASGINAHAFGNAATASGSKSAVIGGDGNVASGGTSVAIGGYYAISAINSKVVFGGGYIGTSPGVNAYQAGLLSLGVDTSDDTPTALKSDNLTAGTTNQIILPNNSAYAFHGTIVAREQAADGTDCAAWKIEGLIRREGSAGATVLVNSATTVLDNTPAWGMALSADTTNGGLAITVTGAAATNIRWVATIHTSEVTYA
jgi:hypothetical protein